MEKDKLVTIDETLIELVKSVRNRAEIFLLIYKHPRAPKLVATLLEDLALDVQGIINYYEVK